MKNGLKESSESNFSLRLCCEKQYSGIFFILHTVMLDTSLYSKMIRKVKFVQVDLCYIDLKTASETSS